MDCGGLGGAVSDCERDVMRDLWRRHDERAEPVAQQTRIVHMAA